MTQQRKLHISNDLGLHLRAAGVLARAASTFSCEVAIRRGSNIANAKSIMSLLSLAATRGTELELRTDGSDELEAMEKLAALIEAGFEEK